MDACGLITEYNPFHQGHFYHLNMAKKVTKADCMIAVMSGNFLQRGEPAVMDKFFRTKAALQAGVDLVIELPFVFAVQNSDIFAKGAISLLSAMNVSSICFGSETGKIEPFIESYHLYNGNRENYQKILHINLNNGLSFPEASRKAFEDANLTVEGLDLSKPNNILGFSYIKEIIQRNSSIKPYTISRIQNEYHESTLTGTISSATSIRKELYKLNSLSPQIAESLTEGSITCLEKYKQYTTTWHNWDLYFPFLQYKVTTMSPQELQYFHGMEEGLEYRVKKTAREATSFQDWVSLIKTKRYTWTRIQRLFTHILVHSTKSEINSLQLDYAPYIRVLGMNQKGRSYLNQIKKNLDIPLFTQLQKHPSLTRDIEEKASEAYYAIFSPQKKQKLIHQEYKGPIFN